MELLRDRELYERVILKTVLNARESVWIATANVKDCRVEIDGQYRPVVDAFALLCRRGVEVRLLHAAEPSGPFLESLRQAEIVGMNTFMMRCCPRVHLKAVLVDDRHLYLGSANLTGAGLGAKSPGRRNFELGIVTRNPVMLDSVARLFHRIWEGGFCGECRRKTGELCPDPLDKLE